MGLESATVT